MEKLNSQNLQPLQAELTDKEMEVISGGYSLIGNGKSTSLSLNTSSLGLYRKPRLVAISSDLAVGGH